MKKHFLPILALSAVAAALLLLAACAPMPSAPAPAATATPAADTPVAPPTQAVSLTVPAPAAGPVPAPVEGQRPLAAIPPGARADRFSGPAAKYIEDNTIYVATLVTDKGNIVAELYPDAPQGVNNFVTLALNGFYDGLKFHRVEPGFVIQGGDPLGTGMGGPGYTIPAEINHAHPRGALAWARTGDDMNPERASSGSQFYITLAETPFLDGAYSVFGYVIEGMEVVDKIAVGDNIQRIDITTATTTKIPTPGPTNTPTTVPTPTVTPTPFAPAVEEGRPLATVEVAKRDRYFNQPPAMTVDKTKKYEATIETDKGKIVMELDTSVSPATVNNFVTLADLGYYDGMPVAHVQEDTYIVFGSPKSEPDSDVGYTLPIEPDVEASKVITGTAAMYPVGDEHGNPVASGSQFFIAFTAVPEGSVPLNVLGKVTDGMDVALKLAIGDIVKTITITQK